MEQDAKETLIAIEQGDTLRIMLSVFVNLHDIRPLMLLPKNEKRQIKLIATERYTV